MQETVFNCTKCSKATRVKQGVKECSFCKDKSSHNVKCEIHGTFYSGASSMKGTYKCIVVDCTLNLSKHCDTCGKWSSAGNFSRRSCKILHKATARGNTNKLGKQTKSVRKKVQVVEEEAEEEEEMPAQQPSCSNAVPFDDPVERNDTPMTLQEEDTKGKKQLHRHARDPARVFQSHTFVSLGKFFCQDTMLQLPSQFSPSEDQHDIVLQSPTAPEPVKKRADAEQDPNILDLIDRLAQLPEPVEQRQQRELMAFLQQITEEKMEYKKTSKAIRSKLRELDKMK